MVYVITDSDLIKCIIYTIRLLTRFMYSNLIHTIDTPRALGKNIFRKNRVFNSYEGTYRFFLHDQYK